MEKHEILISKSKIKSKFLDSFFARRFRNYRERENLSFKGLKTVECLSAVGGEDVLKVKGEALAEGMYAGTSKKLKFYPISIIRKSAETLIGKPIIWDHEKDEQGVPKAKYVVGTITDAWVEGKKLLYEGEIYTRDAIDLISNGAISKVSAGMLTDSEYNYEITSEAPTVFDLEFVELSLVVKPSYVGSSIKAIK